MVRIPRTTKISKKYMAAIEALYGAKQPTNTVAAPPSRKRPTRSPIKPHGILGHISEAEIQMQLVKWARGHGLPLISIPNAGKRTPWAGQRERAMGLTAGVSDLFLAYPAMGFHGLWIELKSKGKKPTAEQTAWLVRMRTFGYDALWFDNLLDAQAAIAKYAGVK